MGSTFTEQCQLDDVGWQILDELQRDARLSYNDLARRVHLSAPAVAERVRRLEEWGVITGYHATVDPSKLGAAITALIRVTAWGSHCRRITELAVELPEVLECHRLTGEDCFHLKVVVTSMPHLEELIDRLAPLGQLATSVVLSSPVTGRAVARPRDGGQ